MGQRLIDAPTTGDQDKPYAITTEEIMNNTTQNPKMGKRGTMNAKIPVKR